MHTKVPREGSLTGLSSSCISARSYNFFHFKNNPVQTSVCRGSAIRVRDTSSFGINVNIPCCSQHANRNWQGFFLIPLTFSSSCFGQRCECFTHSCLFMSALTINNCQATKPDSGAASSLWNNYRPLDCDSTKVKRSTWRLIIRIRKRSP